jgi:hypothetical protein
VRLESGPGGARRRSILIPLRILATELDERLPLAERAKDLPRGRERGTWKAELREALLEGSKDLEKMSAADIARTVAAFAVLRFGNNDRRYLSSPAPNIESWIAYPLSIRTPGRRP